MTGQPRNCGAKTRTGGRCGKPAGWGTVHGGYGSCKLHGGSTESGIMSARKERAMAQARRYLHEVDIDPMQAMLSGVRLAAGIRASYLTELGEVDATAEPERYEAIRVELRRANRELVQSAGEAIRAGAAERLVRQAERLGAVLSTAIEAGFAVLAASLGEALTPELRAKVVASIVARVESFEGQADEEILELPAGAAA